MKQKLLFEAKDGMLNKFIINIMQRDITLVARRNVVNIIINELIVYLLERHFKCHQNIINKKLNKY